jgi:hypothetical protein
VGPRAGMDTQAGGKILSPLPGIEPRSPGCPVRSRTVYCLSYPAPPGPVLNLIPLTSECIFSTILLSVAQEKCPYHRGPTQKSGRRNSLWLETDAFQFISEHPIVVIAFDRPHIGLY